VRTFKPNINNNNKQSFIFPSFLFPTLNDIFIAGKSSFLLFNSFNNNSISNSNLLSNESNYLDLLNNLSKYLSHNKFYENLNSSRDPTSQNNTNSDGSSIKSENDTAINSELFENINKIIKLEIMWN
jgi:hypothetical protein